MKFIESFKAARRAGVPIVAVETADQQGTVRNISKAMNGEYPIVQWDSIRGITPINKLGNQYFNTICAEIDPATLTNPSDTLRLIGQMPQQQAIVFFHNAHLLLNSQKDFAMYISQGLCNLRDIFKAVAATIVLLAPGITLPDELKQDVMVFSEPLPDLKEIGEVVSTTYKDFNVSLANKKKPTLPDLTEKDLEKITDTLIGLSGYSAEQTFSTCLSQDGINRPELWERKCKAIEQTKGLGVYRGIEKFCDIGGVENAKQFATRILNGKLPPRCIVFMDEGEKMFAGVSGDTSGTTQDQLGQVLTFMQDEEAEGLLLVGPAGAAKSAFAKAVGNEGGIPTFIFDLNGMKGQFVGNTAQATRAALKVLKAVSQGRMLFIMTCNNITVLPPELKRRFALGTWFFDLPTEGERKMIWDIYFKKYELPKQPLPNDKDWTGAEIRKCAQIAWRLNIPLTESAAYIVPVAVSGKDKLEELRRMASGKFINAGEPGLYQMPVATDKLPTGKRMIS